MTSRAHLREFSNNNWIGAPLAQETRRGRPLLPGLFEPKAPQRPVFDMQAEALEGKS